MAAHLVIFQDLQMAFFVVISVALCICSENNKSCDVSGMPKKVPWIMQ